MSVGVIGLLTWSGSWPTPKAAAAERHAISNHIQVTVRADQWATVNNFIPPPLPVAFAPLPCLCRERV